MGVERRELPCKLNLMIDRFFSFVETYLYPVFVTVLIFIGIGGALSPELKQALQTLVLG